MHFFDIIQIYKACDVILHISRGGDSIELYINKKYKKMGGMKMKNKKMKTVLLSGILICLLAVPVSAEESVLTAKERLIAASDYSEVPSETILDENDPDVNIYYIDVSPEEWKKIYLDNPVYQSQRDTTIFMFRNSINRRAICYNCGKSSMTLQQQWLEIKTVPVACPGTQNFGDILHGSDVCYRDYCTICGPLTAWAYDTNRENWSWSIECETANTEYPVYVGKSIKQGYNVHNCIDVYDYTTVHGLNCSCH